MYGIGMSSSEAKRAFVSLIIVDMAASPPSMRVERARSCLSLPLLQVEESSLRAETPLQVIADLFRTRQALRDHLRQRNERVDLSGVLAIDHVDSGSTELVGVGRSLVAERIEARSDH